MEPTFKTTVTNLTQTIQDLLSILAISERRDNPLKLMIEARELSKTLEKHTKLFRKLSLLEEKQIRATKKQVDNSEEETQE